MKVVLIDDEKLALEYFEHQLKRVSNFEIIGKFTNPYEGKQMIENHEVDLVFLDIQIPEINGMELAELLLENNPNLPIVFVTAYDKYAIKAFELNAIDYILKPVNKERLLNTVKRIEQKVNTRPSQKSIDVVEPLHLNLFQQVAIFESVKEQLRPVPLKWRTSKAQQIFLYLLHNRGQTVDKASLIELLWPDIDLHKAYQQLYTAIYHLRKTLSQYKDHFKVNSINEGYVLELENVVLDVEQFEVVIHSSLPLTTETIGDYEKALSIFKGDYLQHHDYIWAESERQRLQLQWVGTALDVVEWNYKHNRLNNALELSLEICARYPLEEEAYFYSVKINHKLGYFTAIHQQYDKLKRTLLTELQIEPRPDITSWYVKWVEENKEAAKN